MSSTTQSETADTYALGRSETEARRLMHQHQLYGPLTRQFFVGAGITTGMKVLDLGSGAGDVALLLADLVGPRGRVVGVDGNEDILTTARARIDAAGWTNVVLHHGDIQDLDLGAEPTGVGDQFDAVVGRWVLMYVPDPAEVLRRAASLLRPGGIVAFQDCVLRNPPPPYPSAPLHEQVLRWTTPPPGAPAPDLDMGLNLFRTYIRAGLPAPQLRLDEPIGGGPDWPGFDYLAETVRSLLPFLEQVGAVQPGEVGIDTLAQRLRDEVVAQDGIQLLPAVIGAWART